MLLKVFGALIKTIPTTLVLKLELLWIPVARECAMSITTQAENMSVSHACVAMLKTVFFPDLVAQAYNPSYFECKDRRIMV
jgi:hypothetical protein